MQTSQPQQAHHLEFECHTCKEPVGFSIFHIDAEPSVQCRNCSTDYVFDDEVLRRQLKKFYALCKQIRDSQEILGLASIGVDVQDKQVKIPFKLLLTRLSSYLDLMIGGKPLIISFRFEPVSDIPLMKDSHEE